MLLRHMKEVFYQLKTFSRRYLGSKKSTTGLFVRSLVKICSVGVQRSAAMAALRPSAVLLLSCTLLATASYVRRQDVFSAGPLYQFAAPSRLSCAIGCKRKADCVGFTVTAEGLCQLFDAVFTDSTSLVAHAEVQYIGLPCPPGWYLYRHSCYLRMKPGVKQDWRAFRTDCQRLGSDLASLNDKAEESWMMHHPSRPSVGEYIGVLRENYALKNVDGSSLSYLPVLGGELHLTSACVNIKSNWLIEFVNVRACDKNTAGCICESPLLCLSTGRPCPAGWLALDDYCYHYVSTAMAWQAADDYCVALQLGARLSPVVNMAIWRILYQNFGSGSYIYVGISDQVSEGSFQAIDGTDWSVDWKVQPDNGGLSLMDEDCVTLDELAANDVPCSFHYPFICRAPRGLC